MTYDFRLREGLPAEDRKFLEIIDKFDWHVTKVAPRVDSHDKQEWFAYTTGLFVRYRHPEVIIFGGDIDLLHSILNRIGSQVRLGTSFAPGIDYASVLEGRNCQFRFVEQKFYSQFPCWSNWFYEGEDYPLLQCIWPDANGFYPWDQRCFPGVRELQRFLFSSPAT